MKFAAVLCVLLPVALSAHIGEKRFIESLLNGVDVLDLAKQILSQFGTNETEQQCEMTICPQVVAPLGFDSNNLYTHLACSAICKEAQVLAKTYLSSGSPVFPGVTATASPGGK